MVDSTPLLSTRLTGVAVLLLACHLALGFAQNYLLGANDDRLWLYHTGAQIGRAEASRQLDARVARSLAATGANANKIWRYEARERYRTNYVVATTAYRATADFIRSLTGDLVGQDYAGFLARAMYAGFVATYAAVCIVFLLIVSVSRDSRMLLAVCVAVSALAGLEAVFDAFGDTWSGLPVLLPDAETSETFWEVFGPNFFGLLLNPQVQMSPFGDTPRNHFVLLVIALFALRWRGAHQWSYAVLFALSFLHQSQTGLLAAYLIGADALLRPQLFRAAAGPLAVLTIGTYLARETLGDVVGITRPPVLAAVAAAAVAVASAIWAGLRTRAASRWGAALSRLRERLLARGDVAADLIVIAAFWAVTFPIAALINSVGSQQQSIYFWTQLHGRSMGILRPAFFLGATLLVLGRVAARGPTGRLTRTALTLSAAALVPGALLAATYDRAPVVRLEAALRAMDGRVGASVDWAAVGAFEEAQIYYALARTLDQGTPVP